MNLPDRELLELNELCQALIDGALSDADLLAACAGRFSLLRRQLLENGRVLFLFEKSSS